MSDCSSFAPPGAPAVLAGVGFDVTLSGAGASPVLPQRQGGQPGGKVIKAGVMGAVYVQRGH